jgi:ferric-dicitrate binding protein FerR (iron transport regulator)
MPPDRFDRLCELIQAVCDERITPEQGEELEAWLCQDEVACRVYVQYMNLHASIHWDKAQELEADQSQAVPAETRNRARSPVLGFLGEMFQAGVSVFGRSTVLSLLFAIGMPCVVLAILLTHIGSRSAMEMAHQPDASQSAVVNSVGHVVAVHRCQWGTPDNALSAGAPLPSGKHFYLVKGLLQVAFDDGARVLLRGPASFEATGAGECMLLAGSLVATAPKGAEGFTVQTPTATVVDLGTEFGVSVGENGVSEAHVFAGEVEVGARMPNATASPSFTKFTVGEGAKIRPSHAGNAARIEKISSKPDKFARRIPPETNRSLPEPKILFSHRRDGDPTTEGWKRASPGPRKKKRENVRTHSVREGKIRAWSIVDKSKHRAVHYLVSDERGLDSTLMAEARRKGWVLRARIKLSRQTSKGGPERCFCSYWEDSRRWILRPKVRRDGRQRLLLFGKSSLGKNVEIDIPGSRDRYVDYEMRYCPATNDADVFVNGRFVATVFGCPRTDLVALRFGTFRETVGEARFERVEWGILPGRDP